LHVLVCRGVVSLADAQHAIATDWPGAFRQYVPATPHTRRRPHRPRTTAEDPIMSKKPVPEPDRDRERPDHDLPEPPPVPPARPDDGDPHPAHPIAEPPPAVEPAPQS
jgi:hypothetical protein